MTTNTTPAVERTDADLLRLIARDHERLAPGAYHSAETLRQIADRLASPAPVSEPVAGSGEAETKAKWSDRLIEALEKEQRADQTIVAFFHPDCSWDVWNADASEDILARGYRPAALPPSKPDAPTIPEGMVAYGPEHPDYPNQPKDWDGGPYLCRDGKKCAMRGYGWAHGLNSYSPTADWDRIAYTPVARPSETEFDSTDSTPPVDDCKCGAGDQSDIGHYHESWCPAATAGEGIAELDYIKQTLVLLFEKRGRLRDGVLASRINVAAHRTEDLRRILAALASDRGEIERLRAEIINSPETADFMAGVPIEAAHQRERWGADHDAGKSPFDWFWLIGYLSQKAADAAVRGDTEKARHHTISTGAALANWHAHLAGTDTRMRPGIDPARATLGEKRP